MALKVKLNDDGSPVFSSDGLITLVDDETTVEIQINPIARHVKCQTLEREAPAKNAELQTTKQKLAAFTELQEKHPDLFSDPDSIAGKLQELGDLKTSGDGIDEKINELHKKYGKDIETLKSQAEETKHQHEETVFNLNRRMRTLQYVLPWSKSKILDGYALPRDPALLEATLFAEVDGRRPEFKEDGSVVGWDGAPIVDYGNDGKSVTDPDKILEILLTTHPRRDSIKLSNIPGGGGMEDGSGGGGGGVEQEAYFKPETRNLTKQLQLKASNPVLYDQLKKRYAG